MNPAQLMQLISQDEGQQVEFKLESEKQSDLAEVLMAFANADGGALLAGVTDEGQIALSSATLVTVFRSAIRRVAEREKLTSTLSPQSVKRSPTLAATAIIWNASRFNSKFMMIGL